MNDTLIGGKWELSIGKVLVDAKFLGDITVNYAEGMLEANTQAGVRKQPSNMAETAEVSFTVFLPKLDYLRKLFNIAETDPIVFGGGTCQTQVAKPINIHQVCDGADAKNDIHIPAGLISTVFNPTLATSDLLSVEVMVQMQPSKDGYLVVGYPDPATPQYWDPTTEAYVDIA